MAPAERVHVSAARLAPSRRLTAPNPGMLGFTIVDGCYGRFMRLSTVRPDPPDQTMRESFVQTGGPP